MDVRQVTDTEVILYIKGMFHPTIRQIIESVVEAFSNEKKYLLEICGLDADCFAENAKSKHSFLIVDNKHKFIKDLPLLFLVSDCKEDIDLFVKEIGNFNEGYMCIYVLEKDDIQLCNKQSVSEYICNYHPITICVESDGDVLSLFCYSSEKMKKLCDLLKNSK